MFICIAVETEDLSKRIDILDEEKGPSTEPLGETMGRSGGFAVVNGHVLMSVRAIRVTPERGAGYADVLLKAVLRSRRMRMLRNPEPAERIIMSMGIFCSAVSVLL